MAAPDPRMRPALQTAFDHALRYRSADQDAPVAALADHATLLSRLQLPLTDAAPIPPRSSTTWSPRYRAACTTSPAHVSSAG